MGKLFHEETKLTNAKKMPSVGPCHGFSPSPSSGQPEIIIAVFSHPTITISIILLKKTLEVASPASKRLCFLVLGGSSSPAAIRPISSCFPPVDMKDERPRSIHPDPVVAKGGVRSATRPHRTHGSCQSPGKMGGSLANPKGHGSCGH